jgi:hypothetical protein
LDGLFRIYRQYFKGLALVSFLMNAVFLGWFNWQYMGHVQNQSSSIFDSEQMLFLYLIKVGIYLLIIYPLLQVICHELIIQHFKQMKPSISYRSMIIHSIKHGRKGLLAHGMLVLFLLFFYMLFGSMIYFNFYFGDPFDRLLISFIISTVLFFLPLAYIFYRFSLVIPIITLEQSSFWQAFLRSWELTRGGYFQTLGKLIWLYLTTIPLQLLEGLIFEVAAYVSFQGFWLQLFLFLFEFLFIPLLYPLIPLFFNLVYWDERTRKEAFDLRQKLEQEI